VAYLSTEFNLMALAVNISVLQAPPVGSCTIPLSRTEWAALFLVEPLAVKYYGLTEPNSVDCLGMLGIPLICKILKAK